MKALNAKHIIFDSLKRYSRAEVDLVNWFCRAFNRHTDWAAWFKDGFAQWLEIHKGTAVRLSVVNEIEPQEIKTYSFETDEIHIGRSFQSDIALGVRALGKQHARLLSKDGSYYLEDLGSAIGTYLNDRKLKPAKPELLNAGDRFLIFPFSFLVALEEVWVPDEYLELSEPAIAAATWSEFESAIPVGFCNFEIGIHPDAGEAVVAAGRPFLETIVSRLTRTPMAPLVESDHGILDFLMVSVLERVNSQLSFPFQVALRRFSSTRSPRENGLKIELSIALRDTTGLFRLFLPEKAMARMQRQFPAKPLPPATNVITWRAFVCAGRIDLGLSEVSELAPGDVLLFAEDREVHLPQSSGDPERGWKVQQLANAPSRMRVNQYFERSLSMDDGINGTDDPAGQDPRPEAVLKPDLTSLPVRLHVVLGQIELSLAELNALTCNSIVELQRAKDDPIQLAANGKIIGTGALVEIDGMLGVEISKWCGS